MFNRMVLVGRGRSSSSVRSTRSLFDLDAVMARITAACLPIYFGPEKSWYWTDENEPGVRQVLVQDPDGYLVRLQQSFGTRPTEVHTLQRRTDDRVPIMPASNG